MTERPRPLSQVDPTWEDRKSAAAADIEKAKALDGPPVVIPTLVPRYPNEPGLTGVVHVVEGSINDEKATRYVPSDPMPEELPTISGALSVEQVVPEVAQQKEARWQGLRDVITQNMPAVDAALKAKITKYMAWGAASLTALSVVHGQNTPKPAEVLEVVPVVRGVAKEDAHVGMTIRDFKKLANTDPDKLAYKVLAGLPSIHGLEIVDKATHEQRLAMKERIAKSITLFVEHAFTEEELPDFLATFGSEGKFYAATAVSELKESLARPVVAPSPTPSPSPTPEISIAGPLQASSLPSFELPGVAEARMALVAPLGLPWLSGTMVKRSAERPPAPLRAPEKVAVLEPAPKSLPSEAPAIPLAPLADEVAKLEDIRASLKAAEMPFSVAAVAEVVTKQEEKPHQSWMQKLKSKIFTQKEVLTEKSTPKIDEKAAEGLVEAAYNQTILTETTRANFKGKVGDISPSEMSDEQRHDWNEFVDVQYGRFASVKAKTLQIVSRVGANPEKIREEAQRYKDKLIAAQMDPEDSKIALEHQWKALEEVAKRLELKMAHDSDKK